MSDKKKRVFSGVQPSGRLHLGNYLGALQQWLKLEQDYECIFCVVDWHAITIPEVIKPDQLRQKSREVAALYVACGIDPDKSIVFRQSDIKEHTELTWVLSCTTPLGWLERMTQFKSKGEKRETVGTGLLTYPVLQASDILLYDTNLVPVGEDQKQHIEITRDIAQRFNVLFGGDSFVLPEVMIPKAGARVMGFDDPTAKMSKSLAETQPRHAVGLLDSEKQIKKTLMSAVTDSNSELDADLSKASAGLKNLLGVQEALTGESAQSIADRFAGRGYGYLKQEVLDATLAKVLPIQKRYAELTSDIGEIENVLKKSADRARPIAQATMQRVRDRVGLG